MVPTKGGAVPIGIMLHSNQNTENYTEGMKLMQELWSAFNFSISCFMTDDSKALKSALKIVWPSVEQLLCQFHVISAVWNWLFTPSNNVPKAERKMCINSVREIMYACTQEEAETLFEKCMGNFQHLDKFCKYVTELYLRKEQWSFSFRKHVLNRSHNTNNFAEITFRIFKDLILMRLKAHNSLSLLSFISHELDDYYSSRLTDIAFGRGFSKDKILKVLNDRAQILIDQFSPKFEKLSDDLFMVPSSDGEKMYEVNSSLAICSCVSGCQGAFCKPQFAVGIFFQKDFVNCPHLSAKDKQNLFYVANGVAHNLDFFAPLKRKFSNMADENDKENMSADVCDNFTTDTENGEWSDFDEGEPDVKKRRKYISSDEDDDDVILTFDQCVGKWRKIIKENSCDGFLIKNVSRFSAIGVKFDTGVQLGSFLNNAVERHRRGGKNIAVQPMNINRRKSQSKSRRVQRSGRPLGGVKAPPKRKRNLALNISLNQLNAKSHGQGH